VAPDIQASQNPDAAEENGLMPGDEHLLPAWIVYDHLKDFPDEYVARLWHFLPPPARATPHLIASRSLNTLRDILFDEGYTCIGREPDDDPKIIEVWV
jgi:hypothetical protein